MPFKDAEAARAYQRERKRAERAAVVQPPVQPAALPPAPTREALHAAGKILGIGRGDGESDDAYRERLRAAWRALLAAVSDNPTSQPH